VYTFSKFNDGRISTANHARKRATHTGMSVSCVGMLPRVNSFLDRQPVLPCRLRQLSSLKVKVVS